MPRRGSMWKAWCEWITHKSNWCCAGSINEHHQVEIVVHGSNPGWKNSKECRCYGRVPTACQTEERSICKGCRRKTHADPVTGLRAAMKTAESFWSYTQFLLFVVGFRVCFFFFVCFFWLIMDKRWSHRSSFRCAQRCYCTPARETLSWFSLGQLASSNLLTLEQFPALCFTTANTRTAGHLGHSCAITSSSFIILMRPDYEKLEMNPLISWNTSGYKHNCGALWEPNRKESHPKNNSFSFTLQWTNWKK